MIVAAGASGPRLFPRLLAWMAERFPPANIAAAVLVWAAAFVWGRALSTSGPVSLRLRDAAGALASIGFFLMLRVFDEHKDYAADCLAHPGRVLQRGLITLRHLKIVGIVAVVLQLSASILSDGGTGPVTRAWLVAFAWSLLMANEFFVRDWLRPRLVVYALSHMLVMPFAVWWLVRIGADGWTLPISAWMLPMVSYLTGFAFEIARKLKAPADERDDVDSYTRAFGTQRAPLVLAGVLTTACVGFAAMLNVAGNGWIRFAGDACLAAVLVVAWTAMLRFRNRPDRSTGKACERATGLAIAVSHLVLVVVVIAARGVAGG
jgi:hypothetical protein